MKIEREREGGREGGKERERFIVLRPHTTHSHMKQYPNKLVHKNMSRIKK